MNFNRTLTKFETIEIVLLRLKLVLFKLRIKLSREVLWTTIHYERRYDLNQKRGSNKFPENSENDIWLIIYKLILKKMFSYSMIAKR